MLFTSQVLSPQLSHGENLWTEIQYVSAFFYHIRDKQLLRTQLDKIIQQGVPDRSNIIETLSDKIWKYSSDDAKQRLWNVYERSAELDQVILKALMDGMFKSYSEGTDGFYV